MSSRHEASLRASQTPELQTEECLPTMKHFLGQVNPRAPDGTPTGAEDLVWTPGKRSASRLCNGSGRASGDLNLKPYGVGELGLGANKVSSTVQQSRYSAVSGVSPTLETRHPWPVPER